MSVPKTSRCDCCQASMAGTRYFVRGGRYRPSSAKPPWQRTPPATSGAATSWSARSSASDHWSCKLLIGRECILVSYTMATGTDLRPRPRSRRDPARREAILQTAATVFARSGYAATALDDIAAAAGVTKLIVYRHFESKEALYRAVLEQVFDRQVELFLSNVADGLQAGGSTRA